MSKHINFVISDTLYSSLISYMNDNNIRNLSFAIRHLLRSQLDEFPDSYLASIIDEKESVDWTTDFVEKYVPELLNFTEVIDND